MKIREYGSADNTVVLVHGGPGAAGYLAPVARELSKRFRVLEPLQRRSGDRDLKVQDHVDDLLDLLSPLPRPPAIIGSSWGAMLALAAAASNPGVTGPLVLVGCGTFDQPSRDQLNQTLEDRITAPLQEKLDQLRSTVLDADRLLYETGRLLLPVYSYRLLSEDLEIEWVDEAGHRQTWQDMLELQRAGVYPSAFSAIESPVLMLHGDFDPHPGRMIFDNLKPYLTGLRFHGLPRCGHYPWLEHEAREEFYNTLFDWLSEHAGGRCSKVV